MRYSGQILAALLLLLAAVSCGRQENGALRYGFPGIIDISLTPDSTVRKAGCFTDAGSWMGFTLPYRDRWINGFCGPFSIEHRRWAAQSAVTVRLAGDEGEVRPDSVTYFPGEVYMASSSDAGRIEQRMVFASASTALLTIESGADRGLVFTGEEWNGRARLSIEGQTVTAELPEGETVLLTFGPEAVLECDGRNYTARTPEGCGLVRVALSFIYEEDAVDVVMREARALLMAPEARLLRTAGRAI